jgi:signal recognition particle GTPase
MVLTDLSKRLTSAIRSLGKSGVVEDEEVDKCLNSIVRALMESDVSFKYVATLKNAVKTALQLDEQGNKQKIIQKTGDEGGHRPWMVIQ